MDLCRFFARKNRVAKDFYAEVLIGLHVTAMCQIQRLPTSRRQPVFGRLSVGSGSVISRRACSYSWICAVRRVQQACTSGGRRSARSSSCRLRCAPGRRQTRSRAARAGRAADRRPAGRRPAARSRGRPAQFWRWHCSYAGWRRLWPPPDRPPQSPRRWRCARVPPHG